MADPTLVSDFTGADENPLSEGGNWANLNTSSNPFKRLSNAAGASVNLANNASYWTPGNFGPNLEAYVTLTTLTAGTAGMAFRIQGEGGAATWDGYIAVAANSGITIYRVLDGALTVIGSDSTAFVSGDKIGVSITGTLITTWRQASGSAAWVQCVQAADATYSAAGKIGLFATRTANALDDFFAGTDTALWARMLSVPAEFPPRHFGPF